MTILARIVIQFQNYWIAGGGKAGAGVDVATERDDCKCPAMPMSQIKGTLRETATRLWSEDDVRFLFGTEAQQSPLAFIGQARLPDDVRKCAADAETLEALMACKPPRHAKAAD